MLKRIGLPATLKMRHDAHYVESLTSYSGAAVGRMIPVDQIRPNPDQPRKALGDLRELTDSIREKGVLEPLLVRFIAREDCFYIISGERRYHASRAAGLREVPCIEKTADDAETLEIGLIENLQRKDLTAFEEAEGLDRLGTQFEYTHDDIARKIGRARIFVLRRRFRCCNIPGSAAEEMRGAGDYDQVAAAAGGPAAYREEDAGDVSAYFAGRLDARRGAQGTGRHVTGSAEAAAVFVSI